MTTSDDLLGAIVVMLAIVGMGGRLGHEGVLIVLLLGRSGQVSAG